MQGKRTERVADALREEISKAVQKDLKDPRIGFVTFTAARVSSDLKNATVYYTVVGDASQRRRTEAGLKSATPFLRRLVTARLRLRLSPALTFEFDRSLEQGMEIDALLEKIHEGEGPETK